MFDVASVIAADAEMQIQRKLAAKQYEEMIKMATISMTRKEAAEKLASAKIPIDIGGRYHIIDALEALGLLHIQPEVKSVYVNDINGNTFEVSINEIANVAFRHGIKF